MMKHKLLSRMSLGLISISIVSSVLANTCGDNGTPVTNLYGYSEDGGQCSLSTLEDYALVTTSYEQACKGAYTNVKNNPSHYYGDPNDTTDGWIQCQWHASTSGNEPPTCTDKSSYGYYVYCTPPTS